MRLTALTIGALALSPVAALAQQAAPAPATTPATTPAPAVGATIFDSAGVEIGKVDSITANAVVVNTGTAKIGLPLTSIGTGPKGPALSMTKADLDAAQAKQQAAASDAAKAKLVAGTAVTSLDGAAVGTIKAADGQYVTVTTAKGDLKVPPTGFSTNATGGVVIGMTSAQLAAATKAPAPAASPSAAATPAPAGN